MRYLFAFLLVLAVTFPINAQGPVEDKILTFHAPIAAELQDHGLSGPLAYEVAPYAQLRCIHEDGVTRSCDISYNGMGLGSPNKEVIKRLSLPACTKLTQTSTADGIGSYGFLGPKAHIFGSVAIGLWFDMIIDSDRYRVCSAAERKVWNDSKHFSHMVVIKPEDKSYLYQFEELKGLRDKMLRKVNRAYGPAGEAINQNRDKYKGWFD
jgi:hypothetical protein